MQVNKETGCLSKEYETPEFRLCQFCEEDVIRTSGFVANEDEVGVPWSDKWFSGTK